MIEPPIHLRCTRTGRLYRVVTLTPEQITLRGMNGQFIEPFRPMSEFREMGYERIIGPVDGMIEDVASAKLAELPA